VSGSNNITYYRKRAMAERQMAAASPTPAISSIHRRFAEHYEALLANIEARPPLRLVSSRPESSIVAAADGEDSDEAATQTG
jgi:hypothetical protein